MIWWGEEVALKPWDSWLSAGPKKEGENPPWTETGSTFQIYQKSRRINYSGFSLLIGSHHVNAKMWCNSALLYSAEPEPVYIKHSEEDLVPQCITVTVTKRKSEYFAFLDLLGTTVYISCLIVCIPKKTCFFVNLWIYNVILKNIFRKTAQYSDIPSDIPFKQHHS